MVNLGTTFRMQCWHGLSSSIEEAKKCSNRGGLNLKSEAIEDMLHFLHPEKSLICADLLNEESGR
jgi:hypothetical protein